MCKALSHSPQGRALLFGEDLIDALIRTLKMGGWLACPPPPSLGTGGGCFMRRSSGLSCVQSDRVCVSCVCVCLLCACVCVNMGKHLQVGCHCSRSRRSQAPPSPTCIQAPQRTNT